jgi:hypothetical protein
MCKTVPLPRRLNHLPSVSLSITTHLQPAVQAIGPRGLLHSVSDSHYADQSQKCRISLSSRPSRALQHAVDVKALVSEHKVRNVPATGQIA